MRVDELDATVEQAEAVEIDDPKAREARDDLARAYSRLRRYYGYVRSGLEPPAEEHPTPLDAMEPVEALPHRWREEAETLRSYGAETQADTLERCAGEVEDAEQARGWQCLTLEEASELGGYSYSHLQHLVADGEIPNVGGPGSPRIRRADVPRKPGYGSESGSHPAPAPPKSTAEWLDAAVRTA